MKIIALQDIDDCFDGSYLKEFVLDQATTKPFIEYLGNLGTFEYFAHFNRPFFRVFCKQAFQLKGVEGDNTVHITVWNKEYEHVLLKIQQYIEVF